MRPRCRARRRGLPQRSSPPTLAFRHLPADGILTLYSPHPFLPQFPFPAASPLSQDNRDRSIKLWPTTRTSGSLLQRATSPASRSVSASRCPPAHPSAGPRRAPGHVAPRPRPPPAETPSSDLPKRPGLVHIHPHACSGVLCPAGRPGLSRPAR